MKYRLTKKRREQIIHKIASHLLKGYPDVMTAYVFGSFLTSRFFSDIDLGVFLTTASDSMLDFELSLESRISRIARYPVDVRVLNRAPISFTQNVFRTGKVILDRDPNIRADFEGRILKLFFDFSHFRRRYLREVTNASV
jgi:predicted nucleotidyltransferase